MRLLDDALLLQALVLDDVLVPHSMKRAQAPL
jgi:hypothetical protein